jgi:hypothetical protein
MKTMNSPRFTMRLDPELKNWLETEAKRRDRSAAYLAKTRRDNHASRCKIGVMVNARSVTAWGKSPNCQSVKFQAVSLKNGGNHDEGNYRY